MKSNRAEVNKRTAELCATVLRRIGPATAIALSNELRDSQKLDLTTGELSSILRLYGSGHGILTRKVQRFVPPFGARNLIYYVSEKRESLGWWIE